MDIHPFSRIKFVCVWLLAHVGAWTRPLSSSIPQQFHGVATQLSSTKYGLIWNWVELGGRRFVGHQGSLIGATNLMLANQQRSLGAILLTTGDISTATNHTIEAGTTMIGIMTQLFDCFEENRNTASGQHFGLLFIWLSTAPVTLNYSSFL